MANPYYLLVFLLLCSCAAEPSRIGTKIIFPDSLTEYRYGRHVEQYDLMNRPYKILTYVDSSGCTDCKLKLHVWREYIKEVNALGKEDQVGFLFVFYGMDSVAVKTLLRNYRLEYPVHMDRSGELNKLNRFSDDIRLQTFLLDQDNKVLSVGSPVHIPELWPKYKQFFTTGERKN